MGGEKFDTYTTNRGAEGFDLGKRCDCGIIVPDLNLPAGILAAARRAEDHSHSIVNSGKPAINLDAKTVETDGQPLHSTGKECDGLELLVPRKGPTPTKEMFPSHLRGGKGKPEWEIIDLFISRPGKKLAAATGGVHSIETIWGRGHVPRDPPVAEAA